MNLFQLLFGDWIKLLFDFGGRINRAKYWQTVVIYLVGLLVLYILALVVAAVIGIPELATLLVLLAFIAVVISSTAVGIKRLHDRNRSGWWLLALYLLPGCSASSVHIPGLIRLSSSLARRCRSGR